MAQRSIPPSFFFRTLNRSKNIEEDVQIKAPIKDSRISLSDFLNRKLHKTSVSPKTVQGKQRPFSSPVTRQDVSGSIQGQIGVKKGEAEMNCVLDAMVLKQFKHTRKEKEDCMGSCSVSEVGIDGRDGAQKSMKRQNQFEDKKPTAQKHLVILGDDPRPKQKRREEGFISNKRPKHQYNHYANGSGWWDCNMEGVDNEEVGCTEVWEGVGSTTLGGLEWH